MQLGFIGKPIMLKIIPILKKKKPLFLHFNIGEVFKQGEKLI